MIIALGLHNAFYVDNVIHLPCVWQKGNEILKKYKYSKGKK